MALIRGYCRERVGLCPLKLIVHHSINTERSIPAKRKVRSILLDNTLMVVTDDCLSHALASTQALGPAPDAVPELFLATVSCPAISEYKNNERVRA